MPETSPKASSPLNLNMHTQNDAKHELLIKHMTLVRHLFCETKLKLFNESNVNCVPNSRMWIRIYTQS